MEQKEDQRRSTFFNPFEAKIDPKLLEHVLAEMNVDIDPTAEETKGGSGHVGKMLLSASDKQLALVAYVPKEKAPLSAKGLERSLCERTLA